MANIDAITAKIAELKESLRIKQQSLANIDPKYQMNQAYIARLKADIASQSAELNSLQTELNNISNPTITKAGSNQSTYPATRQTPYDDEGNLNPGWAINDETGEPYYTGNVQPVTTAQTTTSQQLTDQYSTFKNPDGTYGILDNATGDTVQDGLTEQQALLQEQDLNITTPGITTVSAPEDITGTEDPFEAARLQREQDYNTAADESVLNDAAFNANANAVQGQALANQARTQQAIRDLRQNVSNKDWRVRLRLAPGSTYLYNDPNPGILAPLASKTGTDGVIFPYTPSIETAYKANYNPYDLTHSNYRGYFYQNSYVDSINMRCTFTAQDSQEANYLLAVIHFFRSVTKMFYGQDAQRGSPPPLVYLTGLGDFQFQEHPCVVSQFNYVLPPDVDYIRAGQPLSNGTDLLNNRTRTTIASNPLSFAINRLLNNALSKGAEDNKIAPGNLPTGMTYVPTKMEISISLLPVQSRQQVSTQFSLKQFGQGNLLKGGFW